MCANCQAFLKKADLQVCSVHGTKCCAMTLYCISVIFESLNLKCPAVSLSPTRHLQVLKLSYLRFSEKSLKVTFIFNDAKITLTLENMSKIKTLKDS